MPQYMLSVHMVEGEAPPMRTEEDMQLSMKRIGELETDMKAKGAWVFSARMESHDTASVVRRVDGQRVVSDGPFTESKEHMGGFYIINSADLDEALDWAERTVEATGMPIQVWPFFATAQ